MSWRFWNTSALSRLVHFTGEPQKNEVSYQNRSPHSGTEGIDTYLYTCILSHLQPKSSRLENIVTENNWMKLQAIHCRVPVTPVRWFTQKKALDNRASPNTRNISPAATARDDHQGLFFSSTWSNQSSYQPSGPKGRRLNDGDHSGFRLVAGRKKRNSSLQLPEGFCEMSFAPLFFQPFPRVLTNLTGLQLYTIKGINHQETEDVEWWHCR